MTSVPIDLSGHGEWSRIMDAILQLHGIGHRSTSLNPSNSYNFLVLNLLGSTFWGFQVFVVVVVPKHRQLPQECLDLAHQVKRNTQQIAKRIRLKKSHSKNSKGSNTPHPVSTEINQSINWSF